jgi:hypothetical protein
MSQKKQESGILKCFFKQGKLIREVNLTPRGNRVRFNNGEYYFNEDSTFMYEINAKQNKYMPACVWTIGNPWAHDLYSDNVGISAEELNDLLSPSLLRALVLVAEKNPYMVAGVFLSFINLILVAGVILILKGAGL